MPEFKSHRSKPSLSNQPIDEIFALALRFINEHAVQIRSKARSFSCEPPELKNRIFLFIVENFHKFDPAKGCLATYVFSSLHRIRSQSKDALDRIEDVSEDRLMHRIDESQLFDATINNVFELPRVELPGASALRCVADAISGKNSRQIASELGLSKRRINQKLAKILVDAHSQYAMPFMVEGDDQ